MKFLANENFPGPSIELLQQQGLDVLSIVEYAPGIISDEDVMKLATVENRTILTHDSDYGELIFRLGYKPPEGVIYFRIYDFEPTDPGHIFLTLLNQKADFTHKLTVVSDRSLRQRPY
jgi:predicted nuclease of predicted toxin-antitoxin system